MSSVTRDLLVKQSDELMKSAKEISNRWISNGIPDVYVSKQLMYTIISGINMLEYTSSMLDSCSWYYLDYVKSAVNILDAFATDHNLSEEKKFCMSFHKFESDIYEFSKNGGAIGSTYSDIMNFLGEYVVNAPTNAKDTSTYDHLIRDVVKLRGLLIQHFRDYASGRLSSNNVESVVLSSSKLSESLLDINLYLKALDEEYHFVKKDDLDFLVSMAESISKTSRKLYESAQTRKEEELRARAMQEQQQLESEKTSYDRQRVDSMQREMKQALKDVDVISKVDELREKLHKLSSILLQTSKKIRKSSDPSADEFWKCYTIMAYMDKSACESNVTIFNQVVDGTIKSVRDLCNESDETLREAGIICNEMLLKFKDEVSYSTVEDYNAAVRMLFMDCNISTEESDLRGIEDILDSLSEAYDWVASYIKSNDLVPKDVMEETIDMFNVASTCLNYVVSRIQEGHIVDIATFFNNQLSTASILADLCESDEWKSVLKKIDDYYEQLWKSILALRR